MLIAIHITHWLVSGSTVGRFVLSDSMETLELGQLNPGFLLFSVSILVTMIGGRWLCGWACHMGALQDASAWLLRKVGVRPRLFRTRLLGYVPVAVGAYMFIWPTFKRDVLLPTLTALRPGWAAWFDPVPAFPGFTTAWTSNDLWDGLPNAWIAVPFLLVCGSATVYFLGSRGFCRYGCPYGGMFKLAEHLAPVRVRVNLDACDNCARCTAACSMGVRVHEEVRAFGRVVSNDCVKSLDCVSVCPTGAITFGPATPSIIKGKPFEHKPRTPWDTTLAEELLVITTFALTFFAMRGLYGIVPMLMSVGIAICASAAAWVAWRTISRKDARLVGMQLKRDDQLTRPGLVYTAAAVVLAMVILHSASIRAMQHLGEIYDNRVDVPRQAVFTNNPPKHDAQTLQDAHASLAWYTRADSWRRGGFGLASTAATDIRIAWLCLVLGQHERAEAVLANVADRHPEIESLHADLARVQAHRAGPAAARERLERVLASHPDHAECRDLLAWGLAHEGRSNDAINIYRDRLASSPDDAKCLASLGSLLMAMGDPVSAAEPLERAVALNPTILRTWIDLANSRLMQGDPHNARAALEQAAQAIPNAQETINQYLAQLGAQTNMQR